MQIMYQAKNVGPRACFIESDSLIESTDNVLFGVTKWLKLKDRLVNKYKHFDSTGKEWVGDSSTNIMNNEIVKTPKYESIAVPEDLMEQANQSYQQCIAVLRHHCIDVANY